jgi:hypothetical protein
VLASRSACIPWGKVELELASVKYPSTDVERETRLNRSAATSAALQYLVCSKLVVLQTVVVCLNASARMQMLQSKKFTELISYRIHPILPLSIEGRTFSHTRRLQTTTTVHDMVAIHIVTPRLAPTSASPHSAQLLRSKQSTHKLRCLRLRYSPLFSGGRGRHRQLPASPPAA